MICSVPVIRGGGSGRKNQNAAAPATMTTAPAAKAQRGLRRTGTAGISEADAVAGCGLLGSVSRFSRFRSARTSAADWQRTSRSFSSALWMISSSLGGVAGLIRTGGTGARFRIESNIASFVAPGNGSTPVHISYSTTPKENRSVRASNSLPRTCSGDMYATVPTAVPGVVRLDSAPAWRGPSRYPR